MRTIDEIKVKPKQPEEEKLLPTKVELIIIEFNPPNASLYFSLS
jgi:hypothetical protein